MEVGGFRYLRTELCPPAAGFIFSVQMWKWFLSCHRTLGKKTHKHISQNVKPDQLQPSTTANCKLALVLYWISCIITLNQLLSLHLQAWLERPSSESKSKRIWKMKTRISILIFINYVNFWKNKINSISNTSPGKPTTLPFTREKATWCKIQKRSERRMGIEKRERQTDHPPCQ